MSVVLFIIYFIAAGYFISKSRFIRSAGIDTNTILILFAARIAAGCILGAISHYIFHNTTDYDVISNWGIEEHRLLVTDPHRFISSTFESNYAQYGEYFGTEQSYWNDLRTTVIVKVLGILNIFSRENYYINSIFFNYWCFFGSVALYKIFKDIFPGKYWQCIFGAFLLPSVLYFSSGIHRDLIVFAGLCFFCYSLYFSLQQQFTAKRIVVLLLSFLVILLVRNFVAIILLPCSLALFISMRYKIKPLKIFGTMTLAGIAGLFALQIIAPAHNPLNMVAARQQAFFGLGIAQSQYDMDTLAPSVKSFAVALPGAARHAFLSPYPFEFNNLFLQLLSAEMLFYVLLFVLMLFFFDRAKTGTGAYFVFFSVYTAVILLLFAGYITPSAGALIRYRSIYLPFVILPVLCKIDIRKIKRRLNIKK